MQVLTYLLYTPVDVGGESGWGGGVERVYV